MSEIINRSLVQIQTSRALATPERKAGEEREFEIAPGVSIMMCWIPPGEFLMGSPEDEQGRREDEKQHQVCITKGFWMAKTPITQSQYMAVMGDCMCTLARSNYFDLPVESQCWFSVCGHSQWIGFLGTVNKMSTDSSRFSLPTEAQWEYACRAGTTEAFPQELEGAAWPRIDEGLAFARPIGKNRPNAWGLLDMIDNVGEWCSDWYGRYPEGRVIDPVGPPSGKTRVFRGGQEIKRRIAERQEADPDSPYFWIGFRIVRNSA